MNPRETIAANCGLGNNPYYIGDRILKALEADGFAIVPAALVEAGNVMAEELDHLAGLLPSWCEFEGDTDAPAAAVRAWRAEHKPRSEP